MNQNQSVVILGMYFFRFSRLSRNQLIFSLKMWFFSHFYLKIFNEIFKVLYECIVQEEIEIVVLRQKLFNKKIFRVLGRWFSIAKHQYCVEI